MSHPGSPGLADLELAWTPVDDGQAGSEETFAAVRDADGDGWIDDGLPTMRPAPTKAAAEAIASRVKSQVGEFEHHPPVWRKATDAERAELKVPPAWTDVEINTEPRAGVVVRGKDAKGRRQARYSEAHRARMDAIKHARIAVYDKLLREADPRIVSDAKEEDTALATLLIRRTGMRVGSDRETGAKVQAYGATTLLNEHVAIDGDKVTLDFVGKKGVPIHLEFNDPDLAELLAERKEGRGKHEPLFDTNDEKVRRYLDSLVPGLVPKDLRTWFATAQARAALEGIDPPDTEKARKKLRLEIGALVASLLGNDRTQALNSYIDPEVFAWD